MRHNSECVVFSKVVKVQLSPDKEMITQKTTVMSTTACVIKGEQ